MNPERTITVYKELLNIFWEKERPGDHIFSILNFIKQHIPFQHALFQTINNENHTVTNFIEYSSSKKSQNTWSLHNKYQRDHDTILEVYNSVNDGCHIINNVKNNKVLWDYISSINYTSQSAISLLLFADNEYKKRHMMLLFADAPNAFAPEHAELLLALREPLQQLTHDFYVASPDAPLFLSPEGPLPVTTEGQLRRCPGMAGVMRHVDAAAPTACMVLIQGPTGVGKELVAETIHALSPRYAGPLIKVNCGALPETLMDSELFGYEKGAFTGATQARKGFFERAHQGTIYLDEIGELSKSAQARLLRVLESKEIQRLGAERTLSLNVRVIAATHRDLWDMVRRGEFREDLCYRLHVFPIRIPPLGERKEDIAVLADYFHRSAVRQFELRDPPRLSAANIDELSRREWPGNVRQLRHAVERALLLGAAEHAPELRLDSLDELGPPRLSAGNAPPPSGENAMLDALRASGGRIQGAGGAAERLGLHPATLRYRMRKAGIPLPRAPR